MVHNCRDKKLGGDTSILIHDSINICKALKSPFNENIESSCVEIKYKNLKILVSEVYRPPNSDDKIFLEGMQELVASSDKYQYSFICGDFNYELAKSHIHRMTNDFHSFMLDNFHVPHILKPTQVTHSTSTLIDNIYVKARPLMPNKSYVIVNGMSDHYPCLLSYKLCPAYADSVVMIQKRKLTDDVMLKI